MAHSSAGLVGQFGVLGLVFWWCLTPAVAQAPEAPRHPEAGHPFVTAYRWSDYDADPENWTITQDARGVMYFGNLGGVLEYDGEVWRLTPLPNRTHVRALTVDADDRVWVGGRGDFGYLTPEARGRTQFVSLLDHVPDSLRAFDEVWRAVATPEGAYFLTDYTLFRWDEQTMRTWATDAFGLDAVDGSVYVDQAGLGLSRIEGDALRPIPGGERFADITIFTMLPFGDGRVLLGTRSDGLWLYDPAATRFVRFRTEADEILAAGRIYVPGAVLPGGRFAFGTRAAGLVVIDREGRLLLHLGADDGLASNDVGFVYLGRAGDLWLAHRRGLSRVEIDAPFTAFDARSGLPAQVDEMARYEGRLYASTMDGLYRLEPGSRAFRRIEGPTGWTRGLYPTDDGLFIRSYGGDAWRVVGDELQAQRTPFPESDGTNALVHWGRDADWWLVGHDTGLDVVRWDGGRWVREGAVRGVEADVTSIAQDPAGVVWLGTTSEAVVRVQFTEPDDPLAGADVTTFGVEDGLPDVDSRTYRIGSDVYAAAVGGDVFRFDAAASRFVPDPAFDVVRSGHPLSFFALSEGPDGSVWVAQQFGRPARLKPAGGGRYVDASGSLGRLRESLVNGVYPEDDGVAWLMGLEHLVRYDAQADAADASAPTPFFRRVEAGNRVIYGGVGALTDVEVAPDAGTVRFEFAAARYDGVLYRTRLDGLENTWTAWSPESERVFTGLGTGQYALRVQAQGASGEAGPEGVYAFTMLPPPWRTWWAYLGYGLLAVGGLTVAYRARRRRHRLLHRMEMEQLEADKLRELDHARSRFFANVSHEFRTPLTLTIGPLDDVQAGLYGPLDAPLAQQVDLARRNAGRVLDLINQILDVARLESGRTPLRARPLDLGAFVGSVAEPLQAMAERKAMAFEIHRPAAPVEVYADPEQLEKAVTNLLSNALKFTPESGTVRVEVAAEDGMARVAVRDSGPGIPATDLPHVFDRFYQVGGSAQTQLGTGIGLALAKEVVDLHGGTLTVASEEGFGSTFTVTLPLGQAHLSPKQIVDDEPWAPGAARQAPSAEGSGDGFDSEGVAVLDEDADVTTVLVVEDHPEVRAYVRRHLEAAADGRPAYRVLEAADGEAGLVLAKARLPDLVISDVMMPKLDGLGLCRALKADPETDFIPVILLTAKAAPEDKLEGLSEHCDDYLTKPFDVAELRARIANLIAVRTRLRERFRQEGSTSAPGDAPTPLRLPAPEDLTSADDAFLKVVAKAIEAHLGDETFSVERLAEAVGVSRGHLHRKLKALAGQTPTDLIRTVRLERATHLLAGRAGTVSEIAYAVGFKSVGHFSDSFVRAYGCRPSDYAARAEAAEDEPAR